MATQLRTLINLHKALTAPPALLAGAISLNLLGTFLHFGSDAQKHFTLQARTGLLLPKLIGRQEAELVG